MRVLALIARICGVKPLQSTNKVKNGAGALNLTLSSFFFEVNDGCLEFSEGVCGWVNSKKRFYSMETCNKKEMESFSYSSPGLMKESDYQLNFTGNHTGYVKITDMPDLLAFTICFWVKSSDNTSAGTPIWYRVRYENRGKYVTAIALLDYRGFYVYIGETSSTKTTVIANDGKWHHICLVWTSQGGKVNFYYDKSKLSGNGFSEGEKIPGKGEFIVGLTKDQARLDSKAGEFIGFISHVNIFNKAFDSNVITWMSHGCGENILNAIIPWSQFIYGFLGDVNIQRPASCTDKEGSRFIVFANKTPQSFQVSVFESPLYERSYAGHSVCVRFRYIMYGSGRRVLRMYQQLDLKNHSRRLMWAVNESNNTEGTWKYGRIAVPSVAKYWVSLEADVGNDPGYVGVRGLHVIPGYCHPVPLRATQGACDRNFSDSSGLLFSPHHPGYYPPLTRCRWMINVPPLNTIKLRFLEFQLEDHPSCYNDYIEVYSGYGKTRKYMGRYCGQRFPEFLQSSSNVMEITFVSNEKITRTGLKLHYTSEKSTVGKINCVRYEGCPSSCECNVISSKRHDMVITVKTGRELTAIPGNIPSNAAVMLFQRNKVSYLPQKQFSGLSMLTYLDLSGNRIFRIEAGAFGNGSSLHSLKLEWNFIRTLPNGIFDDMINLQTLDCSSNLIEYVSSTTLASLTSLTTLGLGQNRINMIDKDAFNKTRNLQYLYLQQNLLEELPDNIFIGLSRLKILFLNNNKIQRLTAKTFAGLSSLEKLKLENNSISLKDFLPDAFNGLTSLKEIHLDEFILCCYAEKAVPVPQGILLSSLPRRNTIFPSESQTTIASRLSPSPIPSTSGRQLEEITECEGPETDLKLIETPNVFLEETSYSVGFVVAWSGKRNDISMRLIKHFSRVKEDAWLKEAELAKELSDGDGHPNILKYCWHTRSMERYPAFPMKSITLKRI
ncbi:Domain abundant in complement control protein, SUSHI repeat, short complement-like repeat (SCR) [Desmophyllum pertusum]|uniref:Domain abundant in complement control protein, SUSHI repeat, short complement-like repeat (SCR) n=1 Tax=Desmophyllum pertusum TaxID=174260 RepID=A0A9X0CSC6_9CNID|nr:Domain abundant in complement control protein, SUSHI repeat, short complement-like repeat (SCR) [Desmophyllum pertusum]